MKIPCEIVQDLIPLFLDEVCSEQSRRAVAEHLQQCKKCRNLLDGTRVVPEMIIHPEEQAADQAVARGLKKVRRRWVQSLIAVLMIIPMAILGVLTYHQISGRGISFTNMDEVMEAGRFTDALESGKYEKAADSLDFTSAYEEMQDLLGQRPESYAPQMVEVMIGDEKWAAEKSFAEQYLADSSDALQTWSYFAYNGIRGVLIPEAIWFEIISTDPGAYNRDADGRDIVGGNRYLRLATMWGTFMVDEASLDMLTEDELAYFIYYGGVCLLPMEAYEDLKQEVDGYAQKSYQQIQGQNEAMDEMSVEAYTQYRKSDYTDSLARLAQAGFAVRNIGFQSVYQIDDRCIVSYAVEVSCPAGSEVIYLDIESTNGLMTGISAHYAGHADWIDSFVSMIYVH